MDASNRITVFAGTFTHVVNLSMTELLAPAPPVDYEDWSPLYSVSVESEGFHGSPEIQLAWRSPASLSYEVPSDLRLYGSTTLQGPYAVQPDNYQNAGFTSASLSAPGYYFIGRPKPAALGDCP
jgi:hypothetical protein